MAAPTGYPSYAYNATQFSTVIVQNVAAFNALSGPGVWTTTPYAGASPGPTDPGFSNTDALLQTLVTRAQQQLIENRVSNQLLQFGFSVVDDPVTQLRPDILANDSSLAS